MITGCKCVYVEVNWVVIHLTAALGVPKKGLSYEDAILGTVSATSGANRTFICKQSKTCQGTNQDAYRSAKSYTQFWA